MRKYSPSDVDVVWRCGRSLWREPKMDQPLVQILVGVAKIEQSLVEHAMCDTGAGKDFVPTALVHELFGH